MHLPFCWNGTQIMYANGRALCHELHLRTRHHSHRFNVLFLADKRFYADATIKWRHRKEVHERRTPNNLLVCSSRGTTTSTEHVCVRERNDGAIFVTFAATTRNIYTNVVRLPNFRCSDLIKIQSHFKYLNGTTAQPDRS